MCILLHTEYRDVNPQITRWDLTRATAIVSLCRHATTQEGCMKVIAGGCFDGTCPTIYATERGTVVVQGQQMDDTDVTLGDGEVLVEIPAELLKQANA
jgi:uncharacterized protein (DUF779 family)